LGKDGDFLFLTKKLCGKEAKDKKEGSEGRRVSTEGVLAKKTGGSGIRDAWRKGPGGIGLSGATGGVEWPTGRRRNHASLNDANERSAEGGVSLVRGSPK